MTISGGLILDILLVVVVPAAVGIGLSEWAGSAAKKRGWPPLRVRTLKIVITVVWVVIVVAGATATLGSYNFLSALTVSAIAGIAVTLALQTTLQNIIAGFILIRRGFLRLGDAVQISGLKGTVVSIGLIDVVIRTESGTLALISNANLLAGPLLNFTATTRLAGEY